MPSSFLAMAQNPVEIIDNTSCPNTLVRIKNLVADQVVGWGGGGGRGGANLKFMGHPSNIFFMIYFYWPVNFLDLLLEYVLLPAATKLRQGNIFTSVCHSVHREGVCLIACGDIPPPLPHGAKSRPPAPKANTPPRTKSRHPRTKSRHLPPPRTKSRQTLLPPRDQKQTPPAPKADIPPTPPPGIRSTSGR